MSVHITKAELLKALSRLPILQHMAISDHRCLNERGEEVALVTNSLLKHLTWMTQFMCLVPELSFLKTHTLLQFEDSVYRDLVLSLLKPGRNAEGPFEVNLWWYEEYYYELDPVLPVSVSNCDDQKPFLIKKTGAKTVSNASVNVSQKHMLKVTALCAPTERGKLGGSSLKHPKPKATVQEAEAETVDRLKKRKSNTDTEPPPKPPRKKKTKKGEVEETEHTFEVGQIILLVCSTQGHQSQRHLKETKAPNSHRQAEMCQSKLAVASNPAQHLILAADWSMETYTKYLAKLFPDAFRYIESHPYAGDTSTSSAVQAQKWLAILKTHHLLNLDPATKIAIPPMRYSNWDLELESEAPEAGEVSDYDMLDPDNQETPINLVPRPKAKARLGPSPSPLLSSSRKERPLLCWRRQKPLKKTHLT
ncbi:hypothetical protein DFH08DRAFT_806786 [Mycena albidolilacea]|uniref:Uncharacterized protein n=1 Tax=Mycena albidolilacea TaxID=1033008 RepID=A0AAD7A702_9AGAR|nr:hypothetical protein DFH08DRAFT_806786 [Mycena albidolilacea]